MRLLSLQITLSVFCFNPRTRKGCDLDGKVERLVDNNVSIHAPVKDATALGSYKGREHSVSIHAPVKDATY